MKALILAGGQGTRLWPLSRKQKPKQFQKLVGKNTMLQETAARLRANFSWKDIYISTNEEYFGEVKKELPRLPQKNIIAEPANRERIASILLFIAQLDKSELGEPVLVLPSDHVIKKGELFSAMVKAAEAFIGKNPEYLAIIGAKPTFPDTGMGYIKAGAVIAGDKTAPVHKVSFFKEKPNLQRTNEYLKEGGYYWNTAIYVFLPRLIEKLARQYVPDDFKRYELIKSALSRGNAEEVKKQYLEMDKTSLEYSVIENYDKVAVIPADMEWSDVGSWTVLKNVLSSPKKSYIKGNYIGIDSKNVMVHGSFDRLVAGVGIKDLVIVATEDIILVCHKDQTQKVKQVIEKLKKQEKFDYI